MTAAEDFGSGKGPAGQMRLERLNQTALFLGIEVPLDGFRAGVAVYAAQTARSLRLFEVQYRSTRRNLFTAKEEAGELNVSAGLQHGHGAVRRSKIDAEEQLLRA